MAHVVTNTNASGTTYTVKWRDAGRFRQKTFGSSRAAERWALKMETAVTEGQSTERYRRTTHTVADAWTAVTQKDARLKPTTRARYDQIYRTHIAPRWGRTRVRDVKAEDVVAWLVVLGAPTPHPTKADPAHTRTLAPATCLKAHQVLAKAMGYAARAGWISANPCVGVGVPTTYTPEEAVALTPEQVARLTDYLAEHNNSPYELLVRFAAYTGLRAGELAALQVRDVNLLRRTVRVARTLYYLNGEWIADTPKSARSRRTVPLLDDALVEDLTAYLAGHPRRAEPDAPLWPGRHLGSRALDYTRTFNHRHFVRRTFAPAIRATGLPPDTHWHSLRHTAASCWIAAGVPVFKVSRWLGHADVATTDRIYAHLLGEDYSAEAALVSAYVARPTPDTASVTPIAR